MRLKDFVVPSMEVTPVIPKKRTLECDCGEQLQSGLLDAASGSRELDLLLRAFSEESGWAWVVLVSGHLCFFCPSCKSAGVVPSSQPQGDYT